VADFSNPFCFGRESRRDVGVRRTIWRSFLAAVALVFLAQSDARAQWGCRSFGYGNAGFASGYGTVVARRAAWGGGWGWGCGPRWACQPRFCSPCYPGGWYGVPGCGFGGWYGTPWYSGVQSIYLATPAGGGATFFSGGIVPFPVPFAIPVPLAAQPPMTAAGLRQAVAASRPAVSRPTGSRPAGARSVVARPVAPRPASAVQRRRAADLVASGNRHLRGRGGEAGLLAAASAYRRATAVAGDDPDTHIRHAIALTALGRDREADTAASRAVALDGRLADRPAEQPPGELRPIVARGGVILREIAAAADSDPATIAMLADRWGARFDGPLAIAGEGAGRAPTASMPSPR